MLLVDFQLDFDQRRIQVAWIYYELSQICLDYYVCLPNHRPYLRSCGIFIGLQSLIPKGANLDEFGKVVIIYCLNEIAIIAISIYIIFLTQYINPIYLQSLWDSHIPMTIRLREIARHMEVS